MTSITKNKNKPSFWQQVKKNKVSYSMVAPFFIIFFTFTVLPVLMSFGLSFTSFDMLQAPKFIGLDNYINLFLNDEVFLIALKNTFILAVITGPVSYIMAFVFAWLINELPRKIRWLMTLIFYAPSISGSAYLLWQLIFSSDMYGVLNATLMDLGIINAPILWLDTPQYALPILIIVQLWLSLGVSFLAFIAGLQTVDKTLYEAGAIDGIRNRWQELWYITLPQMKPQLMFGAVMQITSALGIAAVSINLLGFPSVEYSGHTIVTHLMDFGSTNSTRLEMGYASAIATVLFFIMLGSNLIVQKIIRRVGT
ncbi:MAG: sugar ABC transporter permease [Bacilli bacterium]|jgi:multiple sugar transport system permease protein|nr:sugar ABC transporter permease [Bacillota bacterium]HOA78022.1 sugar ABC transporter permease [Bacilli bacterium]HPZ26829.1 sugar ABC transporter permease [Bacilli bacterium]HQC89130.1 sugar ABC transporter permease [Bacilli bacterium]